MRSRCGIVHGMFAALIADVRRAGGAAGRAHLVALGHSDRLLGAAVRARALTRARRGWYSIWLEDDPRLRALRVGGRLTGLTAITALGGWVRVRGRMLVAVPANAARLRCPRRRTVRFTDSRQRGSVVLHWTRECHDRNTSSGIVPLLEALEVACLLEPAEDAIAAIDWARRSGELDDIDLVELAARLPSALRSLVARSSGSCHSLPESLARTRLRHEGLRVREQVLLPDNPSPIDLLVNESIALDVDGEEFHRERFLPDRAKDLSATRSGFHALRPAARHVYDEWPAVLEAICVALTARRVPLPTLAETAARAFEANNSGLTRKRRRRKRANPRTTGIRARPRSPVVLSC